LHGANRLASNSLLEAMVFAHRAYLDSVSNINLRKVSPTGVPEQGEGKEHSSFEGAIPDWKTDGTNAPKEMILITQSVKELKLLMSDYVGIVRNNARLQRAMKRLDLLFAETEELYKKTIVSPQLCELRNMITVAFLIVKSAEFRHESRGLHFNTDYPGKSEMIQNIVL
jgi:L-aspartate oxidase